jgi:hypothetical protein
MPVIATIGYLFAQRLALVLAADPTGVDAAFGRVALLFAGVIGGVVGFFVVLNGYQYIVAVDDTTRAMHAKRAAGGLIFGAMIVILGVTIAPALVTAIAGH